MVKRIQLQDSDTSRNKLTEQVDASLLAINTLLLSRLLEMRELKKMTVRHLARISGVSEPSLFEWIRGDYLFERWRTLYRVAVALGVKIKVLP